MAAKNKPPLSLIDIITRADADTIREALEARIKIDDLLVIREEAYKKIFEIENEIEEIVGEEGTFNFGDAPYPVAGMAKKKPRPKPKADEPEEEDDADKTIEMPDPDKTVVIEDSKKTKK